MSGLKELEELVDTLESLRDDFVAKTDLKFADLEAGIDRLKTEAIEVNNVIGIAKDVLVARSKSVLWKQLAKPDTFWQFIRETDASEFFSSQKREQPSVLLSLISTILNGSADDLVVGMPWLERSLLDLDTTESVVRSRGPALLDEVIIRMREEKSPDRNVIGHIARSLRCGIKRQ